MTVAHFWPEDNSFDGKMGQLQVIIFPIWGDTVIGFQKL